jgi:hypothetical protein
MPGNGSSGDLVGSVMDEGGNGAFTAASDTTPELQFARALEG